MVVVGYSVSSVSVKNGVDTRLCAHVCTIASCDPVRLDDTAGRLILKSVHGLAD